MANVKPKQNAKPKAKQVTKSKAKPKAKAKPVVVNRKFLTDLAKSIYDGKGRKFLYLCNGTLQNGPDPTNPKRPMHCGLGELYFAMTGNQPEQDGVSENDVVELAVKLSTFPKEDQVIGQARNAIKSLKGLPKDVVNQLLDAADGLDFDVEAIMDFESVLDEIPSINDDGENDGTCSISNYRERSKRVAHTLREAAEYLPE